MANCSNCGKEIPADRKLCKECFDASWDNKESSENEWKIETPILEHRRTRAS